jgi:hypothetical protein
MLRYVEHRCVSLSGGTVSTTLLAEASVAGDVQTLSAWQTLCALHFASRRLSAIDADRSRNAVSDPYTFIDLAHVCSSHGGSALWSMESCYPAFPNYGYMSVSSPINPAQNADAVKNANAIPSKT